MCAEYYFDMFTTLGTIRFRTVLRVNTNEGVNIVT